MSRRRGDLLYSGQAPELASAGSPGLGGDPVRVLEWIHARFAPVVHGVLVARVRHADVEDLLQEVFMRVQERLSEIRDPAALPGWIVSIARNLATDHLRRQSTELRTEPLEEDAASTESGDGGEELRRTVSRRLAELPEAYRETLVLRLIEGLTGPEIAERTGLGSASVRVNLCRGMAMLRPLLLRDGVLE